MRDNNSRRPSVSCPGPRHGDLSSLPPLIREKIMKDKPAELFRKDLITAMKVPDTEHLDPDSFWAIIEPWKPDYDKGVQIPVNAEAAPVIMVKRRKVTTAMDAILGPFTMPQKLINVTKRDEIFNESNHEFCDTEAIQRKLESKPRYNIDSLDFAWLQLMNRQRAACGLKELSEEVLERVVDDLETRCHNNLQSSQLGIEYDEDTQCDVCLSPESEEDNEMVFCDQCDLCVHQACYGIVSVPAGSWLCLPCARGYNIKPQCALCPLLGGALKPDADLDLWAHVACALWVPEVTIGNPELMQPLQNLHRLPSWRRKLNCSVCQKEGLGVCIQCSVKGCDVAYHVTCAQKAGLTMNMDLHENAAQDALELKSYCRKHGRKTHSNTLSKLSSKHNQASIVDNCQQQFYDFVNPHETAAHLRSVVDPLGADQIFNYWKLKRISCQGKPLLPPKHEESLKPPVYIDDELSSTIRTLVHIRQDLERARNLSYLLQRREKTKKMWIRAREDVTMAQLRTAEEHPHCLRVIRTANRLDDIYDRSHSFEKIYGYPAYSVNASLMRIVAEDEGDDTSRSNDLSSPNRRSPIKQNIVSHTPNSRQKSTKKRGRPAKRRLMLEVDENQPFDGTPLSKNKNNEVETRSRSLSTEILSSPPPLTTLSSPPSSSSTHKFLRIGRRRGGPFKRSMVPDLQSEIPPPHYKHTSTVRMFRKNPRKYMPQGQASPNIATCSNQHTSTDYDSETSVEILTGQELVQSMAHRRKTRRKCGHRRSALEKKYSVPPQPESEFISSKSHINTTPLLVNPRENTPQDQLNEPIDGTVLPRTNHHHHQRSPRKSKFAKEHCQPSIITIVSPELASNTVENTKRKPRATTVSLSSPSQLNTVTGSGEVRVLRHREISISPEKKCRLSSNMVIVKMLNTLPMYHLHKAQNEISQTNNCLRPGTLIKQRKLSDEGPDLQVKTFDMGHTTELRSPFFFECSVRIQKLNADDLEPYTKRKLRSCRTRKQ